MDEKLELELIKKYPKILKDYHGNPLETGMAWGIDTDGNGWYDLLDDCMKKIQYFCDLCSKDGRDVQIVATCIKSKYATLRFYYNEMNTNDIESKIIEDIISEAERKSGQTCEQDGKEGSLCKRGGWYKTLCTECQKTLEYNKVNDV